MARRDVKLIESLVDYVLDVKPYHSKLREFASEILFSDTCNVNVADEYHLQLHLKNVWNRNDLGCSSLSTISEGHDADRFFRLPAAIWPHFTLTDRAPNQVPVGDDSQGLDLSDYDNDGRPDYADPIIQDPRTSHISGSDWIPVPAIISDVEFTFNRAVINHGKGDNQVTNGYFEVDASGWTAQSGGVVTWSNGFLRVTNGASNYGYVKQSIPTVVGKTYVLYVSRGAGDGQGLYSVTNAGNVGDSYVLDSIDPSLIFTARGTSTEIWLKVGGNTLNQYFEWDNVELYEYTADQVYHCDYDLLVYVNTALESAYGFGNYWQAILNGRDVTYTTIRDDTLGSFDNDEFDDNGYDTKVRTFLIKNQKLEFSLTSSDFTIAPWLGTSPVGYVCKYWFTKNWPHVQINYTQTGRYRVNFHQGSRVYVDGKPAVFGSTYTVESSRDFIQFMPGKRPQYNSTISINLMTVDRLFISQTNPFDVNPTQFLNPNWMPFVGAGYDETLSDELGYDIGLPLGVCDYYSFKIDDIYPGRCSPVAFMNATTFTNKPTLTVTHVNSSALNGEIYLVYATGLWTFAFQQVAPARGPVQYGLFKQEMNYLGKVSFIVDKTWTPYYMVPDTNSYSSYSPAYNLYEFKPVDPTDYMVNLSLGAEHGIVTDTAQDNRHRPVEFIDIGRVMKLTESNGEEYYAFVLNNVPRRGVYYELMVEQNGGLNTRLHTSITDEVVISVFEAENDFIFTELYNSKNPDNADLILNPEQITYNDDSTYVDAGYVDPGYVE